MWLGYNVNNMDIPYNMTVYFVGCSFFLWGSSSEMDFIHFMIELIFVFNYMNSLNLSYLIWIMKLVHSKLGEPEYTFGRDVIVYFNWLISCQIPLRTFSLVGCIMPTSLGVNTGPTNQSVLARN